MRALGIIAGAAVAAIQARSLGPYEFGALSGVFLLVGIGTVVSDLGITSTAVSLLARGGVARPPVLTATVLARFGLGLIFAVIAWVAAITLLNLRSQAVLVALVLSTLPMGALIGLQSVAIADLRLSVQNAILAFQSGGWLVAVVIVAGLDLPIVWYGVTYLALTLAQGGLVLWLCRDTAWLSLRAGVRELRPLLRQAIPLGLGAIGVTAYYRLTGIVLLAIAGPTQFAQYAVAFRLLEAMQVLPATLSSVYLPLLSRAFGDSSARRRVWGRLVRLTLASAIVAVGCAAAGASGFISWMFGTEFEEAGTIFAVLVWSFVPGMLGWLVTSALTAARQVRAYAVVTVVGGAVSLGISVLLVPSYGASATAWIAVGTETAIVTALLVLLHARAGLGIGWRSCAQALIIAVVMWATTGLLDFAPYWVVVAVVGVVGVSASFVSRLVSTADVRLFLSRRLA
ncbi:hypothetical protein ASD16_11710 [Cellulomonas sp. Root485]|nr:hypothetical protein ASD16_11710 [Cellulomonas sp. Root485]